MYTLAPPFQCRGTIDDVTDYLIEDVATWMFWHEGEDNLVMLCNEGEDDDC